MEGATAGGVIQVLGLGLLFVWLILALVALGRMRGRILPEQIKLIWVAAILLIPVLGAVAFLLVRPGQQGDNVP